MIGSGKILDGAQAGRSLVRAGVGRLAGLLLVTGVAMRAAEATPASDDDLQIRGVFDSALPRTERRHSLRLIFHPHLGDLRERDYLRTAVGLRYGLSDRWEATAAGDWYVAHGLKSVPLLGATGFSSLQLGTKLRLNRPEGAGWESSVGVNFVRPVGSPPASVTDGLQHVGPFVAFSRTLQRYPQLRGFVGLGYDAVQATGIAGERKKNQLGDDSAIVSAGLLWVRGPITYTLETSYATMHVTVDRADDVVTVRPGFIWTLPPQWVPRSRGRWLFGFALHASQGGDGTDFGVSTKLRVNFDFRQLLQGRKSPGAFAP